MPIIPGTKFYRVRQGEAVRFRTPGTKYIHVGKRTKGPLPAGVRALSLDDQVTSRFSDGSFFRGPGRRYFTDPDVDTNLEDDDELSAGKKKVDYWGAMKKAGAKIGKLVKAVAPIGSIIMSFIPGGGALAGVTKLVVGSTSKLAKFKSFIDVGKKLVASKGTSAVAGLVAKMKSAGVPPAGQKAIVDSVTTGKPLAIMTTDAYVKASNTPTPVPATDQATTPAPDQATAPGTPAGLPAETPASYEYVKMFEPSNIQLQAGSTLTSKEKYKVERDKLYTQLKTLDKNIPVVEKKVKKYLSGLQEKELRLRVYNVRDRARALKSEIKNYGNLSAGAVPLLTISLDSGIVILKKYNQEIVNLNSELVSVNNKVDAILEGKVQAKEEKAENKIRLARMKAERKITGQETKMTYDVARAEQKLQALSPAERQKRNIKIALTVAGVGLAGFVGYRAYMKYRPGRRKRRTF